ncbi:hypothetical protein HMPREF9997_00819 [Corynebacterium durum F0235]|uniref:Uncharacterized protein n=1 Tax=Corynebacterium durum F0235 TaxID=1035195 RepID=L1MJV7_9CORY|nr:hypothetical protein HMPREF9997_00819 [Corynebacterium durum F0235]
MRNHTKKHMSQYRNTSRSHEPTQSNSWPYPNVQKSVNWR